MLLLLLVTALASVGCGELSTTPAGEPRSVTPVPREATGTDDDLDGAADADGSGAEETADQPVPSLPTPPDGWPARLTIGVVDADRGTGASDVLVDLLTERLEIGIAIIDLSGAGVLTDPRSVVDVDVIVVDVVAASAAGYEVMLHAVRRQATGHATAWVSVDPDAWCEGPVENEPPWPARCADLDPPPWAADDPGDPGGAWDAEPADGSDMLAAMAERATEVTFVLPEASVTAALMATRQVDGLGADIPWSTTTQAPRADDADDTAGFVTLVALEATVGGVEISSGWTDGFGDEEPVVIAWGPRVPNDVVAIRDGAPESLVLELADALRDVAGQPHGAAALVDLLGVEGFESVDGRLARLLEELAAPAGDDPS